MHLSSDDLVSYFLEGSPLASQLAGFSHRREQLEMARLVARAMTTGENLAIEAGAGTGKTLAYLVPAMLSGQRVIVATATRTLQDQLYHRDLPILGRAIGRPAAVAQLKGRANYLCMYRLGRARRNAEATTRELSQDLRAVEQWATRTHSGDISEVSDVGEDSAVWPLVTSTADNCLGSRCPDIERCHVAAARRRAAESDLAVVNHHLLVADMALKDDGCGRLLPGASVVIVDEAHRFPETAQAQFDITLHSRQVEELCRDAGVEAREASVADLTLQQRLDGITRAVRESVNTVPDTGEAVAINATGDALREPLRALAEDLDGLRQWLSAHAEAGAGLGRCAERAANMAEAAGRLADWQAHSDLCWVQGQRSGLALHMTPLDSSRQMRELIEAQECTWIFTSATLAVGDDFTHFSRRIGIGPLTTHRIDSPYDFRRCARLYLPASMPPPEDPEFIPRLIDAVAPLLRASRGRAFLLFTSRRSLERAAQLLAARDHGHALLVQGSAPRSRLLEVFAGTDNAVLLGTATFWEGVDIRGPALVVVAIDRLPFASPGDPLMQARLELIRRNGGDPFRDYQLPQAVLALRQGVGRLIRGFDDYGVVMICDPRLTKRSYGRIFLESLPPMPIVRHVDEACAFLSAQEALT
jgi:ATP-dependent DNA helicase DinG